MRWRDILKRFAWLEIKVDSTTDEEHSCKRKVRYGHRETADQAAQHMEQKLSRRMMSYPCSYCDGWHVGSC